MLEQVIKWQTDRNLDKMPYRHGDELTNIVEEVAETFSLGRPQADTIITILGCVDESNIVDDNDKIDAYFDICVYSIGAMLKLGYDPIKVFEEGIKEINERTGKYDPKVGKWVKGEKKPNAYKADYSKAKR